MITNPESPPPIPLQRPTLVWVISILYLLSAGYTILSFVLIFSGVIPLNEAQKHYFQSQTIFDYGSSLLISASNILGAVLLFLMKKTAFYLFAGAFCLGLALTVYQTITKNWLGAIGGPGVVGAIIGWCLSVAVIAYSKRLINRGVLK